jgi:hypothetical protein
MKTLSVFILTIFSFTSCGFIDDILGNLSGNGINPSFSLTIHYDYYGNRFVGPGSPIIFWVMPLDENEEVKEDPYIPDGPPLRDELYVDEYYGTLSIVLNIGDYAILAFTDEDGNGNLDLLEHYVVYNGKSIANGWLDKIKLTGSRTVDVSFGDEYEWHAVFIRYPLEIDLITGDFLSHGGFIAQGVTRISVSIDGVHDGDANIHFDKDFWEYPVKVSGLIRDTWHTLSINAEMSGTPIDSYSVQFYLQ